MKRTILAAASSVALAFTSAPALAQSEEPSSEQLAQMGEMFAGMFTSEPLTKEQEARLPAAQEIVNVMMPEGFYAELMSEMMSSTLEPMMGMLSGATGAQIMFGSRLNVAPEVLGELTDEEKIELATMLDPGFAERGPLMQNMMNTMMVDVAVAIEPGFREGMAKAYAVRFDEAQLSDISTFFDTPTGAVYAQESLRLMADPQVMSATMQSMPAMMEQFGDLGQQFEAAMADLPAERGVDDLDADEKARVADLLGSDVEALGELVNPPANNAGVD